MRTPIRQRALPLFAAVALLTALSAAARPAAAQASRDPVGDNFFPPHLLVQNQQELGLTEEQKESIQDEVRKAQDQFQDLQQRLQKEMAALGDLLRQDKTDEKKALEQLDKVLDAERAIKRAQLAVAVAVKNMLTPEQQAKARVLREKMLADARARGQGPPESLRVKMQKFHERARKLQEDGKDLSDVRPFMEEFQPLLEAGKFKEAEATLDKALTALEEAEKK